MLPNVGIAAEVGHRFHRSSLGEWSVEAQATWQFLDDKTFASDGNPAADDWYQLRAGLKLSTCPDELRHWTYRVGAVWFQANGVPNIVQDAGDYFGGYVGFGFETDVTDRLRVGPEVSVMVVPRDGGTPPLYAVPQFCWHAIWQIGGGSGAGRRLAPLGEIYGGVEVAALPGVGGGITLGQVFARTGRATWSFEGSAVLEDLVYGEGADGRLAALRGSVKAVLDPDCASHWVARAGPMWFRTTGEDGAFVDTASDFWGVHASIGYEWDLSSRVSTGPEAGVLLGFQERTGDVQALPELRWNLIVRF